MQQYDIIFILGEIFFDHPLCGPAILKRLLEKNGYSVGIIEKPTSSEDIKSLGKPNLFFAVSSGSIDSMLRNYTPLKKKRSEDKNLNYNEEVPDRAIIVYSNWIKEHFKESKIVIGGTESTLRRFVHYDYWENRLRRPILFDSRADILSYGPGEKQTLEIAKRIKQNQPLIGIEGTCIISKEKPNESNFKILPEFDEIKGDDDESKNKFNEAQIMFSNRKDLAQKIDTRYMLQYKSPKYTSKDLDEYYELDYSRTVPKDLRGFQFSVVTHRGCVGGCNFCSVNLTSGDKIISRSEKSILNELEKITMHPEFKGNIDDFTGASADMYGTDCEICHICEKDCITCERFKELNMDNKKLTSLLSKARKITGINNIYIRSGIRYDLASKELVEDLAKYHTYGTMRIAPEHTSKKVLKLMNKDVKGLKQFIKTFENANPKKNVSFYFMTAHPGSSMEEATELSIETDKLENTESVQIFTPTPMTISTAMYYTSKDPKTGKTVYVPYTYREKKDQKNVIFDKKKK